MNKKNGFTLIELLSVVIILSIIMVLVITNSTSLFGSTKTGMNKIMLNNLKEAINMYAQDQNIKNCSNKCEDMDDLFENCHNDVANLTIDYCELDSKVSTTLYELVEAGYFKDDSHLCGPDTTSVTITRIDDVYSYDLGEIECLQQSKTTAPIIKSVNIINENNQSYLVDAGTTSVPIFVKVLGTTSDICINNSNNVNNCSWIGYGTGSYNYKLVGSSYKEDIYLWARNGEGNVSERIQITVYIGDPHLLTDEMFMRDGGTYTNNYTDANVTQAKNNIMTNKSISSAVAKTMPSSEEGLRYTLDDSGNTFLFRGPSTKNYIKFAGLMWRIVRINGDGSIRIILNSDAIETGSKPYNIPFSTNTICSKITSGTLTAAEITIAINECLSYNSSNAKIKTEEWYHNNILSYQEYLTSSSVFCEDTTFNVSSNTYYIGARGKVGASVNGDLSLTCNKTHNGVTSTKLTGLFVGLLSGDEIAYTGCGWGTASSNSYLSNSQTTNTWAIGGGLLNYLGDNKAYQINFGVTGFNSVLAKESLSNLKPVVNLNSKILVTGVGTSTDPYVTAGIKTI